MNRSHNRVRGKTPTAGVLLSGLGSLYQVGILRGIAAAASAASARVLCFVGGTLPADENTPCARHRVYDLCGPHNVDGVILLSSTLNHQIGAAGLARYCERYRPLPIVSIGAELEDAATITVDNHAGMHNAISHLIEAHRARRIAFIRGPRANTEAEIRLDAYRTALDRHGVPFDPALVVAGDFMTESGANAARELLKLRGAHLDGIDAIAAANDSMAVGVLSVLEAQGIDVPRRLAIIGFDDVEEGRLTRPPLTTVRQPLEKVGREAFRSFLDAVQFGEQPAPARLETDFVVRRSCGCQGTKSQHQAARSATPPLSVEAALMVHRQDIVNGLTRVARGSFGAAGADWQARLFNAVASEARQEGSPTLVPLLQELMDKLAVRGVDLSLCDELLTALRRHVLEAIGAHPDARERLEESFHDARLAIGETLRRHLAREHLQLSNWTRTLSTVCSTITSTFDTSKLWPCIRDELARLGIQSCFVALYDRDPSTGLSSLLGGYDRRLGQHWDGGASFPAKYLIPTDLNRAREARSFVVMPLSWKTRRFGHVLIELDVDHAFAYWPIAEAISTAVRGAELAANVRTESPQDAPIAAIA